MYLTDTVADMLTRIRNANSAKHDTVDIPASKMKTAIAQIDPYVADGHPNGFYFRPSAKMSAALGKVILPPRRTF